MRITKHAKDRIAQRYQIALDDSDTDELIDLCEANFHAGTPARDNVTRVTVNFRGNIIKVGYNKEQKTVVTVLGF